MKGVCLQCEEKGGMGGGGKRRRVRPPGLHGDFIVCVCVCGEDRR